MIWITFLATGEEWMRLEDRRPPPAAEPDRRTHPGAGAAALAPGPPAPVSVQAPVTWICHTLPALK